MKKIMGITFALICSVICMVAFISCKKDAERYSRYEIIAEYVPETKTLAGVVKFTFENVTDNEFSVLKFQMYPNAYRENALYTPVPAIKESEAYYAGESYGEMVISSVQGSKNWEIMGEDENILCVFLERPLFPGEKVVLDIGFMTKLANVNHRTGITSKTVNLGNFFPILCGIQNGDFIETPYYSEGDPFYSECADYSVKLTTPKEYTVASTGIIASERILESKKEYTMSAMNVRDFAMVLSADYRIISAETNGKTLSYYYYEEEAPHKILELMQESFSFYEKIFGEYPYEEYALAQTGLCLDGAEYPCLSFLSDKLTGTAKICAIAHEVAHQWWYGVVGSNPLDNAWQDEGLADYSALAFFENYEKYEITREGMVKNAMAEYRSYYDVYGSVLGRTDTRMTRNLREYISDYEYQCLSHDKAVIMFDTLRKSVGDDKFFLALKKYYKTCMYKQATVGDLIGSFEKSGLDVSGFFESFLEGKAIL